MEMRTGDVAVAISERLFAVEGLEKREDAASVVVVGDAAAVVDVAGDVRECVPRRLVRLLLEQHEQPREGGEEGGVEVGRGLQEPRAGGDPAAAVGGQTDAGGQTETGPSSAGALVAARASAGAQLALLADADLRSFPEGRLDESRQPLDLSGKNSWSRRLGEVSTAELLHTMAANAIAPFVLCSRLRPLLSAPEGTAPWGHIINVSALEGKFSVSGKKSMHRRIGMCIILGS